MFSGKSPANEGSSSSPAPAASLLPPLTIGAVNDPQEAEADTIADKVMRMPQNNIIHRKCAHCEEEEKAQRKPLVSFIQKKGVEGGHTTSDAVTSRIQSSRGAGAPLPETTRSFMESSFSADFSGVRIHTGNEAAQLSQALNAQAFTVGNDIYFNTGKFSPESSLGKHLLAHELTHTLQQGAGSAGQGIQRMIQVNSGLELDTMGFTVTKSGDFYTCPKVVKNSVHNEIFTSMLHSARIFKLAGKTNTAANASLRKHMTARMGIIDFAAKKKYTFGAGSAFKMNPDYWVVGGGTFDVKPGVDAQEAIEDLNVHPEEYAIACLAATRLTMLGGAKSSYMEDEGGGPDDWIPGDWGYIKNTKFPAGGKIGLEGENIIYVGKDKFWGHFGAGVTYRTFIEWFDEVKGWHGGAELKTDRKFPTTGLE